MINIILNYLKSSYNPRTVFLYGSFLRGDYDEYSDFDCLIIVENKIRKHDDSVIDGVTLDCYIYTEEETETESADVFLPLYDSQILLDDGTGRRLYNRVKQFVASHSAIDKDEKELIISWMKKSLNRIKKGDDEANYRAVTLMYESLPDYFALRNKFYSGSKAAFAFLKQNDAKAYDLYHKAITEKSLTTIYEWVEYVINYNE